MNMIFMRFPDGKAKALTLSYDDGVIFDEKLISIMDKHGIKGTFNINTGCYATDPTKSRRLTRENAIKLYKDGSHEVAVHTYTHPWLAHIPTGTMAYEVIEDRKRLEEDFERPIRGMAYPMGSFSDEVVEVLKSCGIVYSRTTVSTERFNMPTDWLRLPATCHHKNPRLMELADNFLNMTVKDAPQMFYLWGHSYEFNDSDNWYIIEDFCEKVGGKDDIWYATNMEIYEYTEAYNRLVWSLDYSCVTNPTSFEIWVSIRKGGAPKTIKINPGETIKL